MPNTTSNKRSTSRFAFAQGSDSLAALPPKPQLRPIIQPARPRKVGVVSRIVGEHPNPKYGFIQTAEGENIFFHFKNLSIDVIACIERGSEVEFIEEPNPYSNNKPMANEIRIKSQENKFADSTGLLTKWLPEKGFGFITGPDGTIYFAHNRSFVNTDTNTSAAIASFDNNFDGKEVKVVFDKSVNYKASPPKPFALNIRVVSVEEKTDVLKPSPGAWTPSPRTMKARTEAAIPGHTCENTNPNANAASTAGSRSASSWRDNSWRLSRGDTTPRSALFQKYDPNCITQAPQRAAVPPPPPGFSCRDRCPSTVSYGWRTAAAC